MVIGIHYRNMHTHIAYSDDMETCTNLNYRDLESSFKIS